MKPYTKFPPEPPHRRRVWLLIVVFAAVLVANLGHQGGVW